MTLKVALVDNKTGKHLSTLIQGAAAPAITGGEIGLIVSDAAKAFGTFQSVSITTATTTEIVAPNSNGSLIITDIIVSAKRVNNTTIALRFSDGVNSETIVAPDTINNSVNMAWSVAGRVQGWKDAVIDAVTTGSVVASITIGYVKIPEGLPFLEWDALR